MGLARHDFENLEREKTVRILQWFSLKFDDAKMMMTDLRPEVKNLDADHTFADEALRKAILAGEVLKKQECVLAPARQQEKKWAP